MGRRKVAPKREILPDPRYNNTVLSKFITRMMLDGKKSISTHIIYDAMDSIKDKGNDSPLEVFLKAIDNVKPMVEVKSRRVGGATYQVPVEVRNDRRNALAMRWLVQYSRARGEKSMQERLAAELMEASQGRGNAVKKREDTHKMAEANKAFAHYRW